MKFLKKLAILLTVASSASTIICGTSIAQAAIFEQSTLNFHMGLGTLTILTSFATILLFARSAKNNTT